MMDQCLLKNSCLDENVLLPMLIWIPRRNDNFTLAQNRFMKAFQTRVLSCGSSNKQDILSIQEFSMNNFSINNR